MRRLALLTLSICAGRPEAIRRHASTPAEHLRERPPRSPHLDAQAGQGTVLVGGAKAGKRQARGKQARDLAMVHIPVNFGHTMEVAALRTRPVFGAHWSLGATHQLNLPDARVLRSFKVRGREGQLRALRAAVGEGGEVWGMMDPDLRPILSATGCDTYYSPQKYWPNDVAQRYLGGKQVFGVLRDPYDRVANTFRNQVQGVSSIYKWTTREDISRREGDSDRNGDKYMKFYSDCDVNGWLKAEMARYKAGDIFRADCILMPQADFFDAPHGITVPIDNRRLPESFNEAMQAHGYDIRMGNETVHNFKCNSVTSRSLDAESKALVKEVYARDFDLVCKHFGYCDRDEMTCLHQFPEMCGE